MTKAVNVCESPPLKDDLHFTLARFALYVFDYRVFPMHEYQQLLVDAFLKTVDDFLCAIIQIKQMRELEKNNDK